MANEKFSIKEAISYGWNVMKSNLGFFIGAMLIAVVVNVVINMVAELFRANNTVMLILVSLVGIVIGTVIEMGFLTIGLKLIDNAKVSFRDLFSTFNLVVKYLLASILYGLIVLGGMILLIVPGIIWAIQFQFFSLGVIEKGLGPIEALKASSQLTKGKKLKVDLLLFALLILGINALGVLALGFGLFITVPTTLVAYVYIYRKLQGQPSASSETPAV